MAPLLAPGAAWAHAGSESASGSGSGPSWLWLALSLLVLGALYARGWTRLRGRSAAQAIGPWQAGAFAAGSLTLAAALAPQADRVADQLFSAHMVQHLALILLAAPLYSLGRTGVALLAGLPRSWRTGLGKALVTTGLVRLSGSAAGAVLSWILFCGVFAFWHLPGPYGWSLGHAWGHVFEHATFFASAIAFWSVVLAPSARAVGFGGRLLSVTTAAVVSGLPGALMILANRPFYPVHAATARAWGVTPVEDQQLAGLIMWIPAGFVYLGVICWLTVAWLREAKRRAVLAARPTAALMVAIGVLLALPGCEPREAQANLGLGDAKKGAALIADIGCGSCHTIPGVGGADGLVGPPLAQMGQRVYIAGMLRNTPENMVLWLRNPQAVVPGNVMPNMRLSETDARDIAAYLATLR
ncbi:cytochrome c oxidase assembly protein [Alsobacter soli]|nr:cytochrome c oxidase assembly protein [Alsobacter soli]